MAWVVSSSGDVQLLYRRTSAPHSTLLSTRRSHSQACGFPAAKVELIPTALLAYLCPTQRAAEHKKIAQSGL